MALLEVDVLPARHHGLAPPRVVVRLMCEGDTKTAACWRILLCGAVQPARMRAGFGSWQ